MASKPSRVFLTPADQTSGVPQQSLVPPPSRSKDTYFFVPAPRDYEEGLDFNGLASDILANVMVESEGREDIDVSQGAILKWPKAMKRQRTKAENGVSIDHSANPRSESRAGRHPGHLPSVFGMF